MSAAIVSPRELRLAGLSCLAIIAPGLLLDVLLRGRRVIAGDPAAANAPNVGELAVAPWLTTGKHRAKRALAVRTVDTISADPQPRASQ